LRRAAAPILDTIEWEKKRLRTVALVKVKSHEGCAPNVFADALAKSGLNKALPPTPPRFPPREGTIYITETSGHILSKDLNTLHFNRYVRGRLGDAHGAAPGEVPVRTKLQFKY